MKPSDLEQTFDLAIIGGGINGVGVARDAAMRGLSVILFEKNDLCSGSTGACSGLIHGGPRYLETERETTRKSCLDSGSIQKIAPNLLFRVPILIPVMKDDPKLYFEMVETFCKAYDRFTSLKGGEPHVRLNAGDVKALDPGFSQDIVGAVTLDEWGTDPFRLVILNAKSAEMAGAKIMTHTRVEKLEVEGNEIRGVHIVRKGYEQNFVKAKIVVNLTGPWAPFLDPKNLKSIKMRPSKGVHLVLDRRIVNVSLVCKAIDGRESVFILPHEHTTLIGTTDDDYYGHPDQVQITQDEVGYLLQAVKRYFPSILDYRIMRAFVGIRPTIESWGVLESELSRDHQIYDHRKDGVENLFTMMGGKLAAYRMMSEELVDLLCRKLKKRELCRTHLESLPGCTTELPWRDEAIRTSMDPITVKRIMYRHGTKAKEIIDEAQREPKLRQTLCECEQVIASEVEYCVREEWAKNLSDIRRRTRMGMGPCQSCRCAVSTAMFMGELLNWSIEETENQVSHYIQARWKGNLPVLFGEQAKQEEYARFLLSSYGKSYSTI